MAVTANAHFLSVNMSLPITVTKIYEENQISLPPLSKKERERERTRYTNQN